MKKLVPFLGFVLVCTVNCASRRMEYGGSQTRSNEKAGESLEVRVDWLKDKEKAVDMGIVLQNNYKQVITLKYHDMKLELAGEKPILHRPKPGTFELQPGETATRELIYKFFGEPKQRPGPAKFTITNIHAGPMEKPGKKLPDIVMELPTAK